jgi:radical SAM superfamily enzyme YgiQ (UPF0313 family)
MHYRYYHRVFLCDGDALIIPQYHLLEILHSIHTRLPWIERVGTYANVKSISRKSGDELKELRDAGLKIAYMGVESGNDEILKSIRKGATNEQMAQASHRIKEAGIILSVTVLLGIGGIERSLEHAIDTGKILSEIDPDYAGALTVMVVPGTPLCDDLASDQFTLPDAFGLLKELQVIIEHTNVKHCLFTSNHASNYLPIRAWLPEQKEATIKLIHQIIASSDKRLLRPEYLRAL